jgi:hypothetical protein
MNAFASLLSKVWQKFKAWDTWELINCPKCGCQNDGDSVSCRKCCFVFSKDDSLPASSSAPESNGSKVKLHGWAVGWFMFYLLTISGVLVVVAGGEIVCASITPKALSLIASLIICLTCVVGLSQFKKLALQLAKFLVVVNALTPLILMSCAFYEPCCSSITGTIMFVLLFSTGIQVGFPSFPLLPIIFYGFLYLNYRLFKHLRRSDIESMYQ